MAPGRARIAHTCKAPAIGSDGTPVLTTTWTRDGTAIKDATDPTYETTTADGPAPPSAGNGRELMSIHRSRPSGR